MKNIKSLSALLMLTIIGFTSCLKDEKIDSQEYGMINLNANKIIEIPTNSSHSTSSAIVLEDKEVSIAAFAVALAAENEASEDISVTFSTTNSAAIVSVWNASHATNKVQVFPTNLYKFKNGTTAVIPKGSKTSDKVNIDFNAKILDPNLPYAIGVRIASVDKEGYVISGNFKDVLLRFSAKSEWDGNYEVTSVITGANSYNGTYSDTEKYTTVNINTVSKSNIGELFGGSSTFTFNSNGTITPGAFSSAGGSYGASLIESSYDKATHNFKVKFSILGGKYIFDETVIRK